jgi:hypothetical protein
MITVLVVTGGEVAELEGEVTGLSGASPSALGVDEEFAAEALGGESASGASGAAELVSSGAPGLAAPA